MTTINLSVVALPRSVAAGAAAHVSLFVSPRLSPDGTLADFDPVTRWAEAVADPATQITLADQTGQPYTIDASLPDDPSYWEAVFPPQTPVRGWESRSLADRDLQSYPAAALAAAPLIVHALALGSSPIDPPTAARDRLTRAMQATARQVGAYRETPDGYVYDESRATTLLDRLTDGATKSIPPRGALGPLGPLLGGLHQARRFFERPESALPYRERPNAPSPRLPVPERDFHERLTLLGDQPALLRRLGLVIDLKVQELDRLRLAQWLTASIALAEAGDLTLPSRMLCRVAGENLVTVGRDGGDWRDGQLLIGDETRFTVLDLDPDASALKLDRFLWTTPRLATQQDKGEPENSAPPTLKGHGFGVVRDGRATQLADQQAVAATDTEPALAGARAPLLYTEDVTRGMRVEVWDDTAQSWFSLHSRTRETTVDGLDPFTVREEGWVQGGTVQETHGVAKGPVYVHEMLFGWSGWSLSAPHPALSLEHAYGAPSNPQDPERNERLTDRATPAGPDLHVVATSDVLSGTLPRLRYGRSYAMRAWAVDLAGNSVAHDIPWPSPPALPPDLVVLSAPNAPAAPPGPDAELLAAAAAGIAAVPAPGLPKGIEAFAQALRAAAPGAGGAPPGAGQTVLPDAGEESLAGGGPQVLRLLRARVDARRRALPPAAESAPRRRAVERALAPLLAAEVPIIRPSSGWNPAALAAAAAAAGELPLGDLLSAFALALDTVTPLRTLLRWHPIDPPVLVPRSPYTEGESLRHLVVRSGVETVRDPELGDTITLTDVASWAAAAGAARGVSVTYTATCERHLAPPKVSQFESELQGRFDAAMSPGADPADRRRAVLAARREAGSFLDTSIPSVEDPAAAIAVPWARLVNPPDAPGALPTLDKLRRGDPLAPGQYVIHDTDDAILPYLPDPMARGVAMVFPDAGLDRPLTPPISIEGTTADYQARDAWPEVAPHRLVLSGEHPLAAGVDGRRIEVTLPPGDTLRVRLSSSIAPEKLEELGVFRGLAQEIRDDPALAGAAADGWLWALSPAEELLLVHAVPKPLEAPTLLVLNPTRGDADTGATLWGLADLHGPSTDRVDIEATWTQQEDDVALAGPDDLHPPERHAVACTLSILPYEDLAVLAGADRTVDAPGLGLVRVHRARHEFGDTRHRVVAYRARATTRFREHFHPALLAHPDDRSVLGPVRRVSIPSSARPPKPAVRQVLPMFRWEEQTEPDQPFGLRRRRRAGVRIYLDRPWYSSGDGELLGVIVGELGEGAGVEGSSSQWAADPAWHGRGPANRAIDVELDHLLSEFADDRPARPVLPLATLPLVDLPFQPVGGVLGYRPEYDPTRKLWFADLAVDPGSVAWPFLRLAVARYQPESNPGRHLSPIVRCDYVQVPLERTATLTRPDERTARVVLSGPVGYRGDAHLDPALPALRARLAANRRASARLQRRSATVDTDLGWETVEEVALELDGFEAASLTAAWVGALALPTAVPPRRPGKGPDWRVAIEETEWLDADPDLTAGIRTFRSKLPRVVYLDHLAL